MLARSPAAGTLQILFKQIRHSGMLNATSLPSQEVKSHVHLPPPSKYVLPLNFEGSVNCDFCRNSGQLMSNGGAAEIVDPIVKLSDPGPQFKSIISFLKKNSEALAQSRLMFASWPVRTDLPLVFVAIEFPTNEDAAKFAPKLETFLPTVLPPAPEPSPTT